MVLCSPSTRTRQTLELIAPALASASGEPELSFDARLYGAAADELLEALREVPRRARIVMLIGHQPTIGDLARELVARRADRERLGGKFPTAALATFAVPGWAELASGDGRLLDLVKPKQLSD